MEPTQFLFEWWFCHLLGGNTIFQHRDRGGGEFIRSFFGDGVATEKWSRI
jgi:hypothetical protein